MNATPNNFYSRALAGWVDLVRRAAVTVTVLGVVATAAALYYAVNQLGISTATGDMISRDAPYRRGWEDFKRAFPHFVDSILVVIDGDTTDAAEDAAAALAQRLRAEPALFPDVYRPEGDPFFVKNGLLYLSLDELATVTDHLAAAQPLLSEVAGDPGMASLFKVLGEALEKIAKGDETGAGLERLFDGMARTFRARAQGFSRPLAWQEIMAGDSVGSHPRRRLLIVQAGPSKGELLAGSRAMGRLRALAATLKLDQARGVRLRLTGPVPLEVEELESAARGAALAGLVSVVLVTVLLFIGLGHVWLVLATLVTLLMGLAWTAAFATAVVGHLNLISVAFAVLFVGLGVDFGIHFGLRYKESIDRGAQDASALFEASVSVGDSITLSALAAAIGFFAFVGTDFIGLSELGIIAGGSMFIALIASLTMIPAFLTLRPLRRQPPGAIGRLAGAPERMLRGNGRVIVAAAGVLGIAAAGVLPFMQFDFDPLHLKDPTSESTTTFIELRDDDNAATHSLSVLRADRDAAEALARRFESLKEVSSARTLADYVPDNQDEKLEIIATTALLMAALPVMAERSPPPPGQRQAALERFQAALANFLVAPAATPVTPSAKRLASAMAAFAGPPPDSTAPAANTMAARLVGLEDDLLVGLPRRLEKLRHSLLAEAVKISDLPPSLVRRNIAVDGRHRVEILPEGNMDENHALRRFVDRARTVAPDITGAPVVILGAGDAVTRAMYQAMLTAFAAIMLLLLVVLRSIKDTLLVLAPLSLAAVLTVASAVMLDLAFNFANVIVLPLLLGLGVASGIHLVMRARGEAAGVLLSETSTPRAVMFSALTTVGSFGSLALSGHRGTASMGELLTIAIAFTLVCTLVVLPALMEVVGGVAKSAPARATTSE